jgi:transposase
VHVERLPPYAPDLNPIEEAWNHIKYVELANVTCLDLEELHLELHLAIGRIRKKRRLLQSLFDVVGLATKNFSYLCNDQ